MTPPVRRSVVGAVSAVCVWGGGAFHGLPPSLPGSALPRPRPPDGSSNDAAGFTSRYGPLSCTPPRLGRSTLGFDPARFQTKPPACYGATWLLPGPDSHRQATTSLRNERSTTYMVNPPFPLDAPVTDDLYREAEPLVRRHNGGHQPSPSPPRSTPRSSQPQTGLTKLTTPNQPQQHRIPTQATHPDRCHTPGRSRPDRTSAAEHQRSHDPGARHSPRPARPDRRRLIPTADPRAARPHRHLAAHPR